jgi:hypothetical protein
MSLTKEDQHIAKLLLEQQRRQKVFDVLMSDSFAQQRDFVLDRSPRKAAITTRRAGKSNADAMIFFETDLRHPGCNMLYVGVSNETAIRIIYKDCLQTHAKRLKCKLRFNRQSGEITFPSGSKLYILGVDANEDEMKKAFGIKYAVAIIDEAATYKINLREFVYDILEPAVSDFEDGQIVLTGMPNNNTYSFFFDVTTGKEEGWKVHRWSSLDNPYMRDKTLARIAQLSDAYKRTPGFKQMYLGEWAIDEDKLVYKYNEERNVFFNLPSGKYNHVLGIDLGWDDATAFVVVAYKEYDKQTYIVHTYKRGGMLLEDVATYTKHLIKSYGIQKIVIDNANKQAVEDLKARFALPLEPAEKAGKADFIGILNNDMIMGNILFHVEHAKDLIKEMSTLTWDSNQLTKGKRVETASQDNHLCDAFLYAWRFCYHWVDWGAEPEELREEQLLEAYEEEKHKREKRERELFDSNTYEPNYFDYDQSVKESWGY